MQTRTTTEINAETKILGAAFRDFYQNHWPKEFYIDDVSIDFENERGEYILPDDEEYALGGFGWAVWQGPKGTTWNGRSLGQGEMIPVWLLYTEIMGQTQTEVLVAFKIDPDRAQELIKAAQALGARHI